MNGFDRLFAKGFLRCGMMLSIAVTGLVLPACDASGNFTLLGYSSASSFDKNYKTIRVPILQNMTVSRGVEFDLTRAIVQEIESRTHMKVVDSDADLELTGKIVTYVKAESLASPINEQRNVTMTMTVEVVLKNARTGQLLSKAPRRPGVVTPEEVPTINTPDPNAPPGMKTTLPAQPTPPDSLGRDANLTGPAGGTLDVLPVAQPADANKKPQGITITASSNYIPEVGQSITTATQRVVQNMATQIVNMMEMGW